MSSTQSKNAILEAVKRIVVEQLDVSLQEIKDSSTFLELGADSLDTVELVMAIEEEFSIEIPDKDAEKIVSLKQAVDFIEQAVQINRS
uniref:Acyl carrier protein n=1 Tax=Gracilariopsis heteroclada TaxID=172978 RepID=A0A344V629_9FLOR|nr:acyl carrier protein [Gracilariopsis heteroclada]AXE43416.1 acyl carrier protein [Gracilariopsis heteroclada]